MTDKYLQAYYKLDHTCCLNSRSIQYGLINDDDDRDCEDMEDLVKCLDTIQEALSELDKYELALKHKSKKEEAFDIIKKKKVDVEFLLEDWEDSEEKYVFANYNFNHDIELTLQEYALLKEVLL